MQENNHIYDIIAKLLMGSLNEKESKELDDWLASSPRHKQLLDSFLARNDMSQMFDIPAQHKDADAVFKQGAIPLKTRLNPQRVIRAMGGRSWSKVAIAAVAVMAFGVVWWHKYTEIVAPEVPQECLAAMSQSQQTGHSDADITIASAEEGQVSAQKLASLTNVTTESGLDKILESIQQKADVEESELQAQVVTHHDKEFWLTLPDGSRVHLNYGCRLTYPLAFTGDNREVTLDGEAYFFVAKDRRHPFIVHTKYGDVKEYGTEFNVNTNTVLRADNDRNIIKGNAVSVVLVNGSISVTPRGGHEKMMHPNDMALLNGTSAAPEITKVDVAPLIAWNTGVFSFDDCEMDELMMVIARWYNLDVAFANPKDEHLRFTGELDRYSDIHSAIRAIQNVTGLTLAVDDKTLVVK